MNYGLQVVTPAASFPATADEVAAYLRADAVAEADHLTHLRQHAAEEVERYTGRALVSTAYKLLLSDWPRGDSEFASYPRYPRGAYIRALEIPRSPELTITSVKYYPANSDVLTTLDSSKYISVVAYEPGMVYLKEGNEWPELSERPDAVQVEFTAGYATAADVPKSIKQAMLLLCRFYYAGGNPNDVDQGGDDLTKAHLLLSKLRVTGWTA